MALFGAVSFEVFGQYGPERFAEPAAMFATLVDLLSVALGLNRDRLRTRWSYDSDVAFERITVDPGRMGGVPCLRELRVTVSMVLGRLAGGGTVEQLLDDYPYLERGDVLAALEYAAAVVNEREVPVARPA